MDIWNLLSKPKGVSAQINGAMTSRTAYDQSIDSVSIDLNNGFDFIITELSVGIDSMVISLARQTWVFR